MESYYNLLREFLNLKEKDLIPHVTIARKPFYKKGWQDSSIRIPCTFGHLSLYQSLGNLKYKSIWHHSLLMPIEELEHTADRAFIIRGDTFQELYKNAQIALSMVDHRFLPYITVEEIEPTADRLVHLLNKKIAKMDEEVGSFCKAVSFHGEIHHTKTYCWEMIVDV